MASKEQRKYYHVQVRVDENLQLALECVHQELRKRALYVHLPFAEVIRITLLAGMAYWREVLQLPPDRLPRPQASVPLQARTGGAD